MTTIFKKTAAMLVAASVTMSCVAPVIVAAEETYENGYIYLDEVPPSEEDLSSSVFYLGTQNIKAEENGGNKYLLKVARGGDNLPAATVYVNMVDVTASYGDDYRIRVHDSGDKAEITDKESLLDKMLENPEEVSEYNATDVLVNGGVDAAAENLENAYNRELEAINNDESLSEEEKQEAASNAAKLYNDTVRQINELGIDGLSLEEKTEQPEQTDEEAETQKTEAQKTAPKSLAEARSYATGLKNDRQPPEGGSTALMADELNGFADMLGSVNSMKPNAQLNLSFDEGETEKYIEIIPKDNDKSDGGRIFYIYLMPSEVDIGVSQEAYAQVTIEDDEEPVAASVGFAESEYYPDKGFIRVKVVRDGTISQVVSVVLSTQDVTAQNTRDYSRVQTKLIFPFGVTERSVNIPVNSYALKEDAEFKLILSDPAGCEITNGYASGIIPADAVSFSSSEDTAALQTAEVGEVNLAAVLTREATVNDIVTGPELKNVTAGHDCSGAHEVNSMGTQLIADAWFYTGNAWAEYSVPRQETVYKTYKHAPFYEYDLHENLGYSGYQIDWEKDTGKPCYSETKVSTQSAVRKDNTQIYGGYDTTYNQYYYKDDSRFERNINNVFFNEKDTRSVKINVTQYGGGFSKKAKLNIYSVKPIKRPFEVAIREGAVMQFYDKDGNLRPNTEMEHTVRANKAVLSNDYNGDGKTVFHMDDEITVTVNNPYSYLKGVRIVRRGEEPQESNDSYYNYRNYSDLVTDLPVGSTSYSFRLTEEFLDAYTNYNFIKGFETTTWGSLSYCRNEIITYKQNGSKGLMGQFDIIPVLGYYDTEIEISNDERATVNCSPLKPVENGLDNKKTYTAHKGDYLFFRQSINPDYLASYTGSHVAINKQTNDENSVISGYARYNTGENYVSFINDYKRIWASPWPVLKDNRITVTVLKKDLEKFDTSKGIFTYPSVDMGDRIVYTAAKPGDVYAGQWYEFEAFTKESDVIPLWTLPYAFGAYTQNTLYYAAKDKADENAVMLSCENTDDKNYILRGNARYAEVSSLSGSQGAAWMPSTDAKIFVDSFNIANSDDSGRIGSAPFKIGKSNPQRIIKHSSNGVVRYQTINPTNIIGEVESFTDDNGDSNSDNDVRYELYPVNLGTVEISKKIPGTPTAIDFEADGLAVRNGEIIISNDNTVNFSARIENDGIKYLDSDGVERTENVTGVNVVIYNPITNQRVHTVELARTSLTNGFSRWKAQTVFYLDSKDRKYNAGDKVYLEIVTDRVIGNGKASLEPGGESVEREELKFTSYAPIYTGYTLFSEAQLPQENQDISLGKDMSFMKLPVIGNFNTVFDMTVVGITINQLPNNGVRIAVGKIFQSEDVEEEFKEADDGVKYPIGNPLKLAEDAKDSMERLANHDSLIGKYYAFRPMLGMFLDFYVVQSHDPLNNKDTSIEGYVLAGGGLLIGAATKFKVVQYFALGPLPCYIGAIGNLEIYAYIGITRGFDTEGHPVSAINDMEETFWEMFSPDFIINASLTVSAFAGVGLCGTFGVRGGMVLNADYMYNPTIKLRYPECSEQGFLISATIRFWVDLFVISIPISPIDVHLGEARFGYYDYVQDDEELRDPFDMDIDPDDDKLSVLSVASYEQFGQSVMKKRTKPSEWLPEDRNLSLMSTYGGGKSTVLQENGFDSASPQLIKIDDNKLLLAFLSDDTARGDSDRTALMLSVYENGSWSKPVMVQNDGTADFEPNMCKAGDNVLLTWTSRETPHENGDETAFLKELEVYSAIIPITSLNYDNFENGHFTVENIERLTDDEFFDSHPTALYDESENGGDMAVYYLKSEVDTNESMLDAAAPTVNGSVIVYMLYDAERSEWLRDTYFDEEYPDESIKEYMIENWKGQRFLPAAIDNFGVNGSMQDPVITDFDAVSYNGLGVYTFTVDEDNNIDTSEDRELFLQLYNFETHKTYKTIRLTDNNISESVPQLARSGDNTYLFWLSDESEVCYINVSYLIKNGINSDGTIKDDYELMPSNIGFGSRSDDGNTQAAVSSFKPFVDENDNLYITWLQGVKKEDGTYCQEIFASAYIKIVTGTSVNKLTGEEQQTLAECSWSDPVAISDTGAFNDQAAFAAFGDGKLMTVSNTYDMDIKESAEVKNHRLTATEYDTVGSMEITSAEIGSLSELSKGACAVVNVTARNRGIKTSNGYTIKAYEIVDGVEGELAFEETVDKITYPTHEDNNSYIWELKSDLSNANEVSLKLCVTETGFEEEHVFTTDTVEMKPDYQLSEVTIKTENGKYTASGTVKNMSAVTGNDDFIILKLYDNYGTAKNDEKIYAAIPIGSLKYGETMTWSEELSIPVKHFEFGTIEVSVYAAEKTGSGYEKISKAENVLVSNDITQISVNDGAEEISLMAGEKCALSTEYSGSRVLKGGIPDYYVEDNTVAKIENGKLVAVSEGTTRMIVEIEPYGGHKEIKVSVKPKKISSGGSGGGSSASKPTPTPTATPTPTPTPVPTATPTPSINAAAKFTDVSESDWFYGAVNTVLEKGIVSGTSGTTYEPSGTLSRAMFATMLYRYDGEAQVNYAMTFGDVADGTWYTEAVRWASSEGIVNGYDELTFAPNDPVTREQAVAMLYRYTAKKGIDTSVGENTNILSYSDAENVSEYAVAPVQWACGTGVVKGREDGTLDPKSNITRAEIAQIMVNYIGTVEKNKEK